MKKFLLLLLLGTTVMAGDLDQVIVCHLQVNPPPNHSYTRIGVYSDHKTPMGLMDLEYSMHSHGYEWRGHEIFHTTDVEHPSFFTATPDDKEILPLTIHGRGAIQTIMWMDLPYQCYGEW